MRDIRLAAIGASSGGISAIRQILSALVHAPAFPIVLVLHSSAKTQLKLASVFAHPLVSVEEAQEKIFPKPAVMYVAPAGYHLLVEMDGSFSLNMDEPVHFARPSIDVLFETLAQSHGEHCLGIILSGANDDGASGLLSIKTHGGLTYVQTPELAEMPYMPRAAIARCQPDKILSPAQIANELDALSALLSRRGRESRCTKQKS